MLIYSVARAKHSVGTVTTLYFVHYCHSVKVRSGLYNQIPVQDDSKVSLTTGCRKSFADFYQEISFIRTTPIWILLK